MKKLLVLSIVLLNCLGVFAQEQLTPLMFNPKLYITSGKRQQGHEHRYLVDKGNIIVKQVDTLQLPFVDDFTTNTLRSYKWVQNHITDTFYRVIGTCLAPENVTLVSQDYENDTSFSYTFNTTTLTIDSTPKTPIAFTLFAPNSTNCFEQAPQTQYYWPVSYRYAFDTLTGRPVDSLIADSAHLETVFYAPVVYFATADPDALWFDNYAYVNNTYPILPPTIGVATLEGLNEYGLAYDNSSANTYGTADYLTSNPINLAAVTGADSVYLSFFYEPGGLGEMPDAGDSLLVEFKDVAGMWHTSWYITGSTVDTPKLRFRQVLINVPQLPIQSSYYHPTFQFRFRNTGALYGNIDHWHIDYVRLDKNRNAVDTLIQDIAFMYPFPTILKNFTQLPADQLNLPGDLADTIILDVHNLDPNAANNPPATNFIKSAAESYPTQAVVLTGTTQTFNAGTYNNISLSPANEYSIPMAPGWPVDSLYLTSNVLLQTNDARLQNDTLNQPQVFSTVMAYDDGSAESAYGITGTQPKRFGYEFTLNHPDTLVGFQVMFAQFDQNVRDLVFNFQIWDHLELNNFSFVDSPIASIDARKPLYIDSVNGFATYILDSPLIVHDTVYLGWAQNAEETRSLQIGYDLNSKLGRKHMYVYFNATWHASTLISSGSPMMRLLFDTNYWGQSSTTGIAEAAGAGEGSLAIYPNPATNRLMLRNSNNMPMQVQVYNLAGQLVLSEANVQQTLDISALNSGVYLINATEYGTGKIYHHKFVKTAE